MDILDSVRQASFDALTTHPTASAMTITGTMLATTVIVWRLINPARTDLQPNAGTAAHRRRTPTMFRTRKDSGPAPGTYVSIVEPPHNELGVSAYHRLGSAAIRAATDQFYNRVQSDTSLAEFFPLDRMDHLKRHLPLLIGQLLGGPVKYANPVEILRDAHQPLGISPFAYSLLCAHLNTILYGLRVPHDIRIFLMAQLIKVEDLIIAEQLQPVPA